MNSVINSAPKTSHKQNDPVPVASMVVAMATNGMPHIAPPSPESTTPVNYNYWENGREYHGFSPGKYLFPCDEVISGFPTTSAALLEHRE
ncbi:uncharacterized protein BP5553_02355 [Venustampulla echinocandica]|uniref:Uncharacterized protein n=1 Tax=Venustampulla echinocandica TaxID=2656787 RepID=A0A370U3M9_9HELO|nr:uncharacterized protein BP5553_02355 [Venustampulla echinocandica]RDL42376.1 hypothetical protein BP5553_02355 [Venustampulla echinocandica]